MRPGSGVAYDFGIPTLPESPDAEPSSSSESQSAWTWRGLIAVGAVAGDLRPLSIARYAGVHPVVAEAAIAVAIDEGVIVGDENTGGSIEPQELALLSLELDPITKARVHAAVARHLMSQGPANLLAAIAHAQRAGSLVPVTEQVAALERAGRTALSISDYDSAERLLALAEEMDLVAPSRARTARLRDLSQALHGLGRVVDARRVLSRAFDLAERDGDTATAVDLAVRYCSPVDWYSGDNLAGALLSRAEAMDPVPEELTALLAARAVTEMRIPVPGHDDQQMAWVTRAARAQPLAERALDAAVECSAYVRLQALMAWRTTHRAPRFADRRIEISREALDLAQQLRLADRQVDAALFAAVDSLEMVDRAGFDEALALAMWVAERDGNPRLIWSAATTAAGGALLDGDLERADQHRRVAAEHGSAIGVPGWRGADLALSFQIAAATGELSPFSALTSDQDLAALANPLGRLALAEVASGLGRSDRAASLVRSAVADFDIEASLLQNAVRATSLVVGLGLDDLIGHLMALLSPWYERYAVGANGWWCDGPVALALAQLCAYRGEFARAQMYNALAESVARRVGDPGAMRTSGDLGAQLALAGAVPESASVVDGQPGLTDREISIMRLLVDGATNQQIADALGFSVSTIRSTLTVTYRKLGARTRAEAVSRVVADRLL